MSVQRVSWLFRKFTKSGQMNCDRVVTYQSPNDLDFNHPGSLRSKNILTNRDNAIEQMESSHLKFSYYNQAQSSFKPPLIANENAFLGDVFDSTDNQKPLSCGFYRLEKGTPLVYTYNYHEMKIILEGEFIISDETGQEVTGTKGDVFYFPKGSVITFKTDSYGLAFYTGQRARDAA